MAGTAGSKYGIVNDGLPLRAGTKPSDSPKKLKNLRRILKSKRSTNKNKANNQV